MIAVRPSLAPHAAPSWHRRHGLARAIVVRPSLVPPAPIRPLDHLGLVWTVARVYRKNFPHCGLAIEDLAQEGWFGLCIACERYDPGRKVKFGAHARWWIRAAIVDAIEDQAHPVHIPRYVRKAFNKERKGASTGLDAATRACLDAARPFLVAPPMQEARSDEEEPSLANLVVDPHVADEIDDADALRPLRGPITDDRILLRDAVAALPPREQVVIRLGFGLDGGEPLTHAQVAARIGRDRQSARGFRVRALRRLRAMLGVAPPGGHQRKGG
jgi:RNA polymerase primary sigma factor